VITETPPLQAALDELRGELGSDRIELGELVEAGRNRRAAAEALFEAMDSEQFDLDLEAVDRLNAQPAPDVSQWPSPRPHRPDGRRKPKTAPSQ
jgi:hypothetical protein